MWAYYRTTPMPKCRSCGRVMDYWVPGLADKDHEHPHCAGSRIAKNVIDKAFTKRAALDQREATGGE